MIRSKVASTATRTCLASVLAAGILLWTGALAHAAGTAYAAWSVSGTAPDTTGTVDIAATGFPHAGFVSNGTQISTPTGASAFLGAQTPFGAVFGSSQGRPYLNIGAAAGGTPSSTTYVFDYPTPAGGWGFALGDIDADQVTITATGADGQPVPASALGFQGVFNYCVNSPKPSSCTGTGPFTDLPTWDPSTSTLRGNVLDTLGATGWFMPTVRLTSLTFTFTVLSGFPIYQTWMAALTRTISGTVDVTCPPPAPASSLMLSDADGNPVPDNDGTVAVATGPNGEYEFPTVAAGQFQVEIEPPAGYLASDPSSLAVDTTAGDVTSVDFTIMRDVPPPDAPEHTAQTQQAEPVTIDTLAGATGEGLIVTGVSQPSNGTAQLNPDGIVTYQPAADFTGTDSFTYTIADTNCGTATGQVTVTITAPSSAPPSSSGSTPDQRRDNLPVTGIVVAPMVLMAIGLVIAGLVLRRMASSRTDRG